MTVPQPTHRLLTLHEHYLLAIRTEPTAINTMPTIHVPHLNGTDVGYRSSTTTPSKPTLVLIVPFTTTVDYYDPEFANRQLTDRVNLIAVEPLGHGATRSKTENFTYWDSAIVFLQLLDALDVKEAFVLGTSQGGWMGVRMGLLAPERVRPYPMPAIFLTIGS